MLKEAVPGSCCSQAVAPGTHLVQHLTCRHCIAAQTHALKGRCLPFFPFNIWPSNVALSPPPSTCCRYVLRCEGVDARIAQNAREDSGLALAAGLLRLMSQLQGAEVGPGAPLDVMAPDASFPQGGLGPTDEPGGEGAGAVLTPGSRPVALVVSDDVRLVRQLSQLRDSGFSVVLASGDARLLARAAAEAQAGAAGAGRAKGGSRAREAAAATVPRGLAGVAQALLDWEALRWGEYAT